MSVPPTLIPILEIVANGYAKTSCIAGVALPFVVANVLMGCYRLVSNVRNVRAAILLIASLGILVAEAALLTATTKFRGRSYFSIGLGVTGWIVGLVGLNIAGTMRFVVPLQKKRHQTYIIFVSVVYSLVFGAVGLAYMFIEIGQMNFAGLSMDPFSMKVGAIVMMVPVFYTASGLLFFSYTLHKTIKETGAIIQTPGRLQSVTWANHGLMGLTLLFISIYFSGMWYFKVKDPSLDTPTAVLFNSSFLAMENIFEITANAVHHQASKTSSRGAGNAVGQPYGSGGDGIKGTGATSASVA
ncbi:hypothetical protein BC832DRAFT_591689 [Gaertneriomyces semiglobifer]|nr:hypothetical protein BC832DRAFT_591689 [Gaertneriomyces semiglobifer]